MFRFRRAPRLIPRRPGPGLGGTAGILFVVLFLGMFLGLVCAFYPPAFTSKLAVILLGVFVLVLAFVAARKIDIKETGGPGRTLINIWVFLLGACPFYLPFKFGPLPGLNPIRVAFISILAIWLYGIITSPRLRATMSANAHGGKVVWISLSALFVWRIFCAAVGEQPLFSLYQLFRGELPALLMLFVALTFYRNWVDLQKTALWLVMGALVACIAGFLEWRTRSNVFLAFFPSDREQLVGLEWILVDKARGGDYRVSATFAHPLLLAEFLCLALPMLLMLAASAWQLRQRLLALCCVPFLLSMIYLSYTRSSLIAASISLLVIGLLFGARWAYQPKRPGLAMLGWMLMVVVAASAITFSGSVAYLAKGRTVAEAGSSDARVAMLKRGQALLEERPLNGYGPGLGAVKIGLLPGQRVLTIDSYYLSLAVESGFVGLLLFVIGLGTAVAKTMLAAIRAEGVASWVLISLSTALLANLVIKIALSLEQNIAVLYLLVGMSVAAIELAKAGVKAVTATGDQRPAGALAAKAGAWLPTV